ncbi:beta-galactosidase [Phormidium sp. FACHB-1136]|uniref:beta-galactosidase n=1 Tax=Phormidium sp. FACHB-1136 TaxID=2692848 RepID=UPI00168555A8|nr:beta-galactosidase [Phormidium sp. FACHB-1136]MBD2428609.1 beta-galactosidase [Phormidium sp. FACHB-1136]
MRPWVEDGVLFVDGKPCLLLAGEYPYYRDPPALWLPKLRAMRLAGLEVVSFYIPWRHHEMMQANSERVLVFDADGNRNLVGFLRQIQAAGLLALPKPGPFVHAELPFGGLPDRLSPSLDAALCAAVSVVDDPVRSQRLALPSPFDPVFLAESEDWLHAVGDQLRPWLYPEGPIVSVQIGNEGHYGEMALALSSLDYSDCGLADFKRAHPNLEASLTKQTPAPVEALTNYLAWGAWSAQTTMQGLERMASHLGVDVPAFANHAPPKPDSARPGDYYNSWVARSGARSSTIHYAYTSWVGNVVCQDRALLDYVLMACRRRGPNLEENWSLSWVEADCAHACVPIYTALLGLACGATGLDVYTACATSEWGDHLAIDPDYLAESMGNPRVLSPPYGEAAPITATGAVGPSLPPMALLMRFLKSVEECLARAQPEPGLNFCLDPSYAAVAFWEPACDDLPSPSAADTLIPFLTYCLQRHIPFALTDPDSLTSGPIVAASGRWMAESVQRVLASHVQGGGALLLLGELPDLDEAMNPCLILADAVDASGITYPPCPRVVVAADTIDIGECIETWLTGLTGIRRSASNQDYLELRRMVPESGSQFVFFFSRRDNALRITADVDGKTLTLVLPPRGCGVAFVAAGKLVAGYLKGLNEKTDEGVVLDWVYGKDRLLSRHPCDVSFLRQGEIFEFNTQGGPPMVRVERLSNDR